MLTRSGLGTLVAAVLLAGLGWLWNYEELVVASAAIAVLLLFALWASQRPFRATVRRRLMSVRVPRGTPIQLRYRLVNDSRFRTGRATIIDTCDGQTARVPVAPIGPDSMVECNGTIPTRRRGIFEVGPFAIERTDPLWLSIGRRANPSTSKVTVHPRVYDLSSPHGTTRVVENESVLRRTATDPLSGFVSMREYVPGDDPRLIHWPTSAHTGTLMVREHVEVRRPEFTVVLDAVDRVCDPADFEEAVDVAATLAVHGIRQGLGVVIRTTDPDQPGVSAPIADEARVLDLLTPVRQTSDDRAIPFQTVLRGDVQHTTLALITGPIGPSGKVASIERSVVVRVGRGADAAAGAGLAVEDGPDFVRRWKGWR